MDADFPREINLALAIGLFGIVTWMTVLAVRHPLKMTAHPLAARLVFYVLWGYALLRLYSASSYLWAGEVEHWVLDLGRYSVVSIETAMFIMACGVVSYYLRKRKE